MDLEQDFSRQPPALQSIVDPNHGDLHEISGSSLEQSNVDLGQEFVNMIQYQRGFQANSRVITVADAMLQELVNIIR